MISESFKCKGKTYKVMWWRAYGEYSEKNCPIRAYKIATFEFILKKKKVMEDLCEDR